MAGALLPAGLVRFVAAAMAGAAAGAPSLAPVVRQQAHTLGLAALALAEGHVATGHLALLLGAAWHEVRKP